jgi:muconolactone delta-isomerase
MMKPVSGRMKKGERGKRRLWRRMGIWRGFSLIILEMGAYKERRAMEGKGASLGSREYVDIDGSWKYTKISDTHAL